MCVYICICVYTYIYIYNLDPHFIPGRLSSCQTSRETDTERGRTSIGDRQTNNNNNNDASSNNNNTSIGTRMITMITIAPST